MSIQYIDLFLKDLSIKKQILPATIDAYKHDLNVFKNYLDLKKNIISKITLQELRLFLEYLKNNKQLSATSLARKISCLKTFYVYLSKEHGFENSAERLSLPKLEKKLPKYLLKEQINNLLMYAQKTALSLGEKRNSVMLSLLYSSGMRITELISLPVSAVDFVDGTIKILGHDHTMRVVQLSPDMVTLLREYFETTYQSFLIKEQHAPVLRTIVRNISSDTANNTILFPAYYAGRLKPISRQYFWGYLKKLSHIAGIEQDVSPELLRNSLAVHKVSKGVSMRSLQVLLGHEQVSSVQVYQQVEVAHLRKIYDKKHPRS